MITENCFDKKTADGSAVFHVDNPTLWNAENPYLYELKFIYKDEVITQKDRLQNDKISEQYELLINDTPVKIQGVNHHDTHPVNGWVMTDEELFA